jgi:hypothetical protein
MEVSAELRWFWHGGGPSALAEWFCDDGRHGCRAGGGRWRGDDYLRDPRQPELGIKRRGGGTGVEIKGLVAVGAEVSAVPFAGRLEVWTKWTSSSLALPDDATVRIEKRRRLRKFDTSTGSPTETALDENEAPLAPVTGTLERGCIVELTEVQLRDRGDVWWTLGFESFGRLTTVEDDVRLVAATLAARNPPGLDGWSRASYPEWLIRN